MKTYESPNEPRPFWQHMFLGLLLLLLAAGLSRIDAQIIHAADPAEWPGDLKRMFSLSELFAHTFGIALIIFGVWHLTPAKRPFIPRLIACAALPSLAAQLIKLLISRSRPTTYLSHHLVPHWPESADSTWFAIPPEVTWNVEYATQSFPSAHAALACGMAIGLSLVFPNGRRFFLVVAVIAALQRVIFFAHWPSDVAAGAALGFLITGGMVQNWGVGGLCTRLEQKQLSRQRIRIAETEPSDQPQRKAA